MSRGKKDEGGVASWPNPSNPAGSRCKNLSKVGVLAPATVASLSGSRFRLVNLLLRS